MTERERASLWLAYPCVNVRSQIHQVLHQREETLNRGHVEAVLTWNQPREQKLSNRHPLNNQPGKFGGAAAPVTQDRKGAK